MGHHATSSTRIPPTGAGVRPVLGRPRGWLLRAMNLGLSIRLSTSWVVLKANKGAPVRRLLGTQMSMGMPCLGISKDGSAVSPGAKLQVVRTCSNKLETLTFGCHPKGSKLKDSLLARKWPLSLWFWLASAGLAMVLGKKSCPIHTNSGPYEHPTNPGSTTCQAEQPGHAVKQPAWRCCFARN